MPPRCALLWQISNCQKRSRNIDHSYGEFWLSFAQLCCIELDASDLWSSSTPLVNELHPHAPCCALPQKKINRQKRSRRIDKFHGEFRVILFAIYFIVSQCPWPAVYLPTPPLWITIPICPHAVRSHGSNWRGKEEAGQLTSPMVSFGHFCLPNYFIVTWHPSPAIFLCQTPQITPHHPATKSLTEK